MKKVNTHNITPQELAEYLKFMRAETGLNQVKFAKLIHVSSHSINTYESAKVLPKDVDLFVQTVRYAVAKFKREQVIEEDWNEYDPSHDKTIVELFNEGLNVVKISLKLCIDEENVMQALKNNGFKPVPYKVKDTYWVEFQEVSHA